MTFEEFRATGREVFDLSVIEHIAACGVDGRGRVYVGNLFMCRAIRDRLSWCVPIGSTECVYDQLENAERCLYDFARREGYIS